MSSFEGLFAIPGFSRYGITPFGLVFNRENGNVLDGSTNPDGYVNFRLMDDNGHTLTWGRHRLLAYVFKHPGVNIDTLVVNHINAIKGDDRLDNLEWTTNQGNIEHAGALGLTEKCTPISVRDVDTGLVMKYPSIVECARYLGMTKDAINYRVKAGENRVFPERKQYRPSHKDCPWYVPENINLSLLENSTSKQVCVRFLLTKEVKVFSQMSELAIYLNTPASTLTLWINQPNQAVLPGYIQLKWGVDKTPWREVLDPYLELDNYTGKRSVKVIHDQTKETRIFSSAVECARAFNLSPTALNYRLKSNGQQVFADGFRYSYYSVSI